MSMFLHGVPHRDRQYFILCTRDRERAILFAGKESTIDDFPSLNYWFRHISSKLFPVIGGSDCSFRITLMPTPFESALLNLQLFDLRREPVLREARSWFLNEFNPESFTEFIELVRGDRNAFFRMVIGYWDMAASLVTSGAIDGAAFRAAHGEIFATFSKVQPFLAELRSASQEPDICKHMEAVVLAEPDAEAILTRRREVIRAAAKARASKSPRTQTPN